MHGFTMYNSTFKVTKCYFESGYLDTKVYLSEKLSHGHEIEGPAIIIDKAW
jgi:5-oxoprolinase (ATP-hydrolysing)